MSVTDVTARIQQLQGQLALLGVAPARSGGVLAGGATPRPVEGTPATRAAQAAQFSQALAGADSAAALERPQPAGQGGGAADAAQRVIAEARKHLGVPYVWGGTDPATGLDCSGLTQLAYRAAGVELPRVSYQQAREGTAVASLAQARPGDLLAFGSPVHHVAIYLGDNQMIEAPRPGKNVQITEVYETPSAIRRVLPEQPVAAASSSSSVASVASVASAGASRVGGDLPAGTPYADLFGRAQQRYGVPATLLAAVAHQESGYNPQAVSPAGARGLMQLMPSTARALGVDAMSPADAVDGAARLLKDLIGEFRRVDWALAAYNAGPGAVHRYNGVPPYRETQAYVPAVLGYQRRLENA